MKKILSIALLSVLLLIVFSACSKQTSSLDDKTNTKFENADETPSKLNLQITTTTDFGGDIAIIGDDKYPQQNALSGINYLPYIIIDKRGQEIFRLPEGIVVAQGYDNYSLNTVPAINNYVFAGRNFDSATECTYVYDANGNIVLSADKNDFSRIITTPENFKQMVTDGFLPVEKTITDYTGTKKYFGIINFDGNIVFDYIKTGGFGNEFDNIYYGDGIFYTYNTKYIDLKNAGITSQNIPRDVLYLKTVYNRVLDENCLPSDSIFELESHAKIGEYYNGKAGVIYNEAFSEEAWFGVIDEKGALIFEPIKIDESRGFENIYMHDNGILIQDDDFNASLYDLSGNFIKSISLPNDKINEFSSGYFNIGNNYLNADGELLFR